MKALIVKKLWLDKIFDDGKVWEMRSTRTKIRGKIGLIESGSGMIVGEAHLMYCTDNQILNYDTQKPKALIERIIKASSIEGDLVADFYLGSGTTAEVCKDLNRNFIGCDINPRAIEITLKRLNDARS